MRTEGVFCAPWLQGWGTRAPATSCRAGPLARCAHSLPGKQAISGHCWAPHAPFLPSHTSVSPSASVCPISEIL